MTGFGMADRLAVDTGNQNAGAILFRGEDQAGLCGWCMDDAGQAVTVFKEGADGFHWLTLSFVAATSTMAVARPTRVWERSGPTPVEPSIGEPLAVKPHMATGLAGLGRCHITARCEPPYVRGWQLDGRKAQQAGLSKSSVAPCAVEITAERSLGSFWLKPRAMRATFS